MTDGDDCAAIDRMNYWEGKLKYTETNCPVAALAITDPTGLNSGWNPGRRCGKPSTKRLSYGTAVYY
jgi:hypothetical protein